MNCFQKDIDYEINEKIFHYILFKYKLQVYYTDDIVLNGMHKGDFKISNYKSYMSRKS